MSGRTSVSSSRLPWVHPRAARLRLIVLLAAGISIPSSAEASWSFFGEVRLTAGWAENPRLLDQSQPSELRGGQMAGTSGLTFGARSSWERSDLEFSYSPYGEFYEDSDLGQVSHALGFAWDVRYTPRLSLSMKEDFSYNPELPTDPNGVGLGGALISDTSITASDFRQALSFRATEKSTLAWTFRNIQRVYSSDQLLDTSGNAFGMGYSRTFGSHVIASSGYEFGVYSFRDGLPPPVTPAFRDFCERRPTDPNCIVFFAVEAEPPAEDLGFDRHRAYAGYVYDFPAGFHVGFDGGYDFLVYSDADLASVSWPFVRSSLGWNGTRLYSRFGYEQGLDEGGGIMTAAELRRGRADGHVRLTDNASFDMSVIREVRESLDGEGTPSGISLITLRGGTSFTYTLIHGWALIALVTFDRQTTSGTSVVPTETRTTRYALGASWSFDR